MEVTSIVLAIISILAALFGFAVAAESFRRYFKKKRKEETALQRALAEITLQLSKRREEVAEIQRSLEKKLREDIETYGKLGRAELAELTIEDVARIFRDELELRKELAEDIRYSLIKVEDVARIFREELKKEGRRSFWRGVLVNFVFFVLGAGLSFVFIQIF